MGALDEHGPCGALGDFGIFSFNGNKMITTSGGGMLISRDAAQRQRALQLATQAREPCAWYEHREMGYNYRLSNLLAGMGRAQLTHLEEHRAQKQTIYERYLKGLSDLPLRMNPYRQGTRPNFWLSCLLLSDGCEITPENIARSLERANVETRPLWKPMHLQPLFEGRDYFCAEDASVTEQLFCRGLCLPSDIKMTKEEQDEVIGIIRACFI
jgi:dTDP-4-amino-4,6-dideoxygalactose transaminase